MGNPFRKGESIPYRCLDQRVHERRRALSPDARLLLDELWFGQHGSPCGVTRLPKDYLLHDLNWRGPRLQKAFADLEADGWVIRDGDLIALPDFLSCNFPHNENVLKSWGRYVSQLPDSPIFEELYRRASAYVTDRGLSWLLTGRNVHGQVNYEADRARPGSLRPVTCTNRAAFSVQLDQVGGKNEVGAPQVPVNATPPSESFGNPSGILRSSGELEKREKNLERRFPNLSPPDGGRSSAPAPSVGPALRPPERDPEPGDRGNGDRAGRLARYLRVPEDHLVDAISVLKYGLGATAAEINAALMFNGSRLRLGEHGLGPVESPPESPPGDLSTASEPPVVDTAPAFT